MEVLVIAPPVATPAEPPSGAFTLAAGLAGHGVEVGLLDLSLALFHDTVGPDAHRALAYLADSRTPYEPQRHRSAAGTIHRTLRAFGQQWPGWRLSPMDLSPPERIHDPLALAALPSPFGPLWSRHLWPALAEHRPRRVAISLAYLSQLPATIDLVRELHARGVPTVVGGSLPNSLAHTGHGLAALERVLGPLTLGDGGALLDTPGPLLTRLAWPRLLHPAPYLSRRPIIPLPLTTGCYWNRCKFCPDRGLRFHAVPLRAMDALFSSIPSDIRDRRPVIHLLDSALPPAHLLRFLDLSRQHALDFYGFARPTRHLLPLLAPAAQAGCLMLQLGVEGGSGELLDVYDKGLDPAEATEVFVQAAAHGVRTYLYLLFGLPAETPADRAATHRMVADHADSIDFLNLSIFNLPHDSELTEHAAEHGIEVGDFPEDGAIRLYRPFTVGGVDVRAQARRFLEDAFRPDPAIRPIIQRTPRWFRAAHLALMAVEGRRD